MIIDPQKNYKMIIECAKSPETTIKERENELGLPDNTYLAYLTTPERAKLGLQDNFTARIYIYIYTHIDGENVTCIFLNKHYICG